MIRNLIMANQSFRLLKWIHNTNNASDSSIDTSKVSSTIQH
jgi:hypothetical protein